jgi:Sulfotransferase domain
VREMAPTGRDPARFRSMGFGLHYDNMALMGRDDVILPSIGGAGSSLLGNILLALGLNYVDPTREVLLPDGESIPPADAITARVRNTGDAPADRRVTRKWPRFAKTHLPAPEYEEDCFGAVWLLVRDPRDALFSWYRYHREFAQLDWEKVDGSFAEFLSRPFFTDQDPVGTWCSFNRGWLDRMAALPGSTVLRFEDLKRDPEAVMRKALEGVGVRVPAQRLREAAGQSTFEAMRAHEDRVAGGQTSRVMRSGKVSGWTDWMDSTLRPFFTGPELAAVAGELGYRV